jgi:hypothetical protein
LFTGVSWRSNAFEAKRISAGQSNFVVSFHEADVYDILKKRGVPNRYASHFERDSSGAALFVTLIDLKMPTRNHALIITESELKIIELPAGSRDVGYFNNLDLAYYYVSSQENVWCVFFYGGRLLWKEGEKLSRFSSLHTPGNEFMTFSFDAEPNDRCVRINDRERTLFAVAKTDFKLRKVFYRNERVYVFGWAYVSGSAWRRECWIFQGKAGQWVQQRKVILPEADEVMDLDPESSNVICYKWGWLRQKTSLFNLDTGKTSKVNLKIWRDHGYFLREGVVRTIEAALRDGAGIQ